jgi:hypothetical protein
MEFSSGYRTKGHAIFLVGRILGTQKKRDTEPPKKKP